MRAFVLLYLLFCLWMPARACEAPSTGKVDVGLGSASININRADLQTLRRLKGVGAVKAQAIVDYRETHGEFASVDELLEVKGIGKALLQKNLPHLSVD